MNDLIDYVPFDKWIPIDELIVGKKYLCKGRNFNECVWTGKGFEGMRTKWGHTYLATELHWDTCKHFGTVKPFEQLN